MSVGVTVIQPPIIGATNARTLTMTAVQLADGSVGIAASGIAAWGDPRPATEIVPRQARVVDIRVFPDADPANPILSLEISQSKRVNEIASMINGLPTVQVIMSCLATIELPGQHRQATSVSFTFRATSGGRPLATAEVTASATAPPTGCNPMTMRVLGRAQPNLLGGAAVVAGASKLLQVRLSRPQP